jgi:hypothetical protein
MVAESSGLSEHVLRAWERRYGVVLVAGGAGAGTVAPLDGLVAVRDLAHWRSVLRLHAPELEA